MLLTAITQLHYRCQLEKGSPDGNASCVRSRSAERRCYLVVIQAPVQTRDDQLTLAFIETEKCGVVPIPRFGSHRGDEWTRKWAGNIFIEPRDPRPALSAAQLVANAIDDGRAEIRVQPTVVARLEIGKMVQAV